MKCSLYFSDAYVVQEGEHTCIIRIIRPVFDHMKVLFFNSLTEIAKIDT